MEDDRIIDLYWQRDEEAIAQTDSKYGAYCHAVAFGILRCREDAEECVSDTYRHAWTAMPPERPSKLRLWLGVVVRNITVDMWRRNHARRRYDEFTVLLSELDDCVPADGSVEREADARALGAAIGGWLAGLKEADRRLFMRRYWYGESVKEIALSRSADANALAQKLYRLRGALKKHLEREGALL